MKLLTMVTQRASLSKEWIRSLDNELNLSVANGGLEPCGCIGHRNDSAPVIFPVT
jgi:hypothetical protein